MTLTHAEERAVKRKIAAVLMADVAGSSEPSAEEQARLAEYRSVVCDVITRGGGRMLPSEGTAALAEFQSAVDAVRAAVEVQESVRTRDKWLAADERPATRLGVAIGEVRDGESETPDDVPEETRAAAARLVALAAPGGISVSRSVREAVASKLKLKLQDLTVEGGLPDFETPTTAGEASTGSGPVSPRRPGGLQPYARSLVAYVRSPMAAFGAAGLLGLAAVAGFLFPSPATRDQPPAQKKVAVTTFLPAVPGPAPATPLFGERKSKSEPGAKSEPGGSLEFKQALAPDPSVVLTARRMLPNAWKECHDAKSDVAVKGCKTLIDSGIAKDAELADIHIAHSKALRDRHELDKAIESLTAALAVQPTPMAYSLRGTVHYDKGSWELAISDYTDAIRLDPSNGEAYNNRAWTFYQTNRPEKALADADAAVRLLARESYVWDTRAHINAALGKREAAISDFRAAIAIDPKNAASKAGLASLGVN